MDAPERGGLPMKKIAFALALVGVLTFVAAPGASAVANPTHASCFALFTSYFKYFGFKGQVGPMMSGFAHEDGAMGQWMISPRATLKGNCDD
jgi:hypothetical protein